MILAIAFDSIFVASRGHIDDDLSVVRSYSGCFNHRGVKSKRENVFHQIAAGCTIAKLHEERIVRSSVDEGVDRSEGRIVLGVHNKRDVQIAITCPKIRDFVD